MKQSAQRKGRGEDLEESVFLSSFPEADERYSDPQLEKKWDQLFLLRSEVNKALEIKRAERFLGNSLEAKVTIRLPEKYRGIVSDVAFLSTFFIVSAAGISDDGLEDSYKSEEIEGLEIKVERAAGEKCQRCWNRSEAVGTFPDAPEVCERCYKVITIKP